MTSLNLFQNNNKFIPLAERLRPKTIKEVIGHTDVVGENSILLKSLREGQSISFILWGSPGVGKTTISRLISKEVEAHFISLSAVTSGVKDLREAIEKARINRDKFQRSTVLFIDEIHRFNKSQQDALLHAVENGTLILIGATTENPSFEINSALLSRMKVLTLHPLNTEELSKLIDRALSVDEELKKFKITIEKRDYLIQLSGGDGRKCLSFLESAFALAKTDSNAITIKEEHIKQAAVSIKASYDKNADYHYDTISAFIKSIRGSDPDAAIIWLARMLDGGEDPVFIARRLIISASEDIGNADPSALGIATNGMDAVKAIGMPEARIVLAQVTTYLASTAKSNAAYLAIGSALMDIQKNPELTVPLHLRNAPTTLMKNEGYGSGYKYSHDFPQNFVEQNYFPDEIPAKSYYIPTENGREKNLKSRLIAMWNRIK